METGKSNTTTLEQRTPEWFAARKGRITGSMAGACLGMAPYMTPEQAMRSMVRSYHGVESEFMPNVATDYFSENRSSAQWSYEMEVTTYDPYVLIKCPYGKRNDINPEFTDAIDNEKDYANLQVTMHDNGLLEIHYYTWTPHATHLETVQLDKDWLDKHIPQLNHFYANFEREIDNPEHLEPLRKEVNTNLAISLAGEYDDLQEAIDNATERLKEVKAEMIEMCDGKSANIGGKRFTLVEKKGSVSWAKVAKKHCPDVDLTSYTGASSTYWKVT